LVFVQDKWKTLVHTAKISPQQRRGEPVPQELLNRVLNAHGYWTQQQMQQLQQNVNKLEQETQSQTTEGLLLL
jgi:polyhydroxyalkanoate synthesis regulator phasin